MIRGNTVLVALSGGADSVSLLHLMLSFGDEFGFEVSAAHVNHMLRGEESERDEQFVRALCEKLSVKLYVHREDVAKGAADNCEGIEEYGRKVRYTFFESLTDGVIATAHTLSDNLETVLLHLTRGSALNGLCGIPPVRDRFIRPLIACTREEIEEYCEKNGIDYVTDSTNKCTDYSRNRIRNLVIPELKKINPSLLSAVERCTDSLTADEEYLSQCAKELLERSRDGEMFLSKKIEAAHTSLKRRVLRLMLCERMKAFPQKKHIDLAEKVLSREASAVEVERGVVLKNTGGRMFFDKELRSDWEADVKDVTLLPFGRAVTEKFNDREYIQKINKKDLINYFSYDKVSGELKFRNRRQGDKLRCANSSCTKSMKKLFEERSVPSYLRNDVAVITDNDRIVWVEGIGCDDEFKLTADTECAVRITIIRDGTDND